MKKGAIILAKIGVYLWFVVSVSSVALVNASYFVNLGVSPRLAVFIGIVISAFLLYVAVNLNRFIERHE